MSEKLFESIPSLEAINEELKNKRTILFLDKNNIIVDFGHLDESGNPCRLGADTAEKQITINEYAKRFLIK